MSALEKIIAVLMRTVSTWSQAMFVCATLATVATGPTVKVTNLFSVH